MYGYGPANDGGGRTNKPGRISSKFKSNYDAPLPTDGVDHQPRATTDESFSEVSFDDLQLE